MATLASDLIEETRSHLLSSGREDMSRLNGAITSSTVTLTLDHVSTGLQRGALLAIDLELIYVYTASINSVTDMQRGYRGSAGAAHNDDAPVYINPRFTAFGILRAINAELASYTSPANGLYRIRTVDLTYSAVRSGYDLTGVTDLIDILSVEAKGTLAGDRHRINRWRLIRDADTADFASGKALYLYEGPSPGKVIEVAYKAPFTALATLADNVQTVSFLPESANDIPPLGAAARLLATREARRAMIDSQPEPRQAADVPPGANRNAAAGLLALRNQRLMEESSRLHSAYPSLSRSA